MIQEIQDGTPSQEMMKCLGISVDMTNIYHFLCRAFGQRVSIAQIVDFNVFDIVTISNIHVTG